MELIKSLEWRYATKKFDVNKKVANDDLQILKESIRLTATSYGLQPFKVKVLNDPALKEKLVPATFGQLQVADCSHVFVFVNLTKVEHKFIDHYIQLCASERDLDVDNLQGYSQFMKKTLDKLSESEVNVWSSKQAYIGMSNLLTACAHLRIDACPIEGFDPNAYNDLLGFSHKDLSACVVVAVGYRAKEDQNQHLKKVRLPQSEFFI